MKAAFDARKRRSCRPGRKNSSNRNTETAAREKITEGNRMRDSDKNNKRDRSYLEDTAGFSAVSGGN